MKVALDARKLGGLRSGIAQYVLELAKWLPRIAPKGEFHLLVDHDVGPRERPSGCRVVELAGPEFVHSWPAKLNAPWWMNVAVRRHMETEGIQLFHGTNFVVPLTGSFRCVVTIHDLAYRVVPNAYGALYRRYVDWFARAAIRRSGAVIADSYSTQVDLVRLLRVARHKIKVIHLGVADDYSPMPEDGLLARVRSDLALPDRFVLHVGVVQLRKNIETLIEASASLLREGLMDAVVVAGADGFGAESVRRTAAQSGLEGRIRFLGHVPQDLTRGLYSLASVLAMPSLYEGFGMPVLEAMASGTPVIASNISSLPEVAGGAALLVTPGDTLELRAALRRLLTDQALRSELRAKGLVRAADFTWADAARKHLEVYERVLAGSIG